MMDTNVSRTTAQRSLATTHSRPADEKIGQTTQPVKGAAAEHSRIALRAYELYERRGRQDGRALEDWLDAERQLVYDDKEMRP
jgi:Protein of unknown function (DUF2934)